MPKTVLPLGNKPFVSPYHAIGIEIKRNLFIELSPSETAKVPYYLVKIPGLERFNFLNAGATPNPCRGLYTTSTGRTFQVAYNKLYEIFATGARIVRGIINSYAGAVSMADNGQELMIVDGVNGYIYNTQGNSLSVITDDSFPSGTEAPTSVVCLDTYFIVNRNTTQYFQWSFPSYTDNPLHPGKKWDASRSNQSAGIPDLLLNLKVVGLQLWAFGKYSTEVFYDTGIEKNLFVRHEGAVISCGLLAKDSPAVYANNVFWLGTDQTGTIAVFTNEGAQPKRVSKPGIEQIFQSFSTLSDAIGYIYSQNGHVFYVLQFPTANRTFVYDHVMDAWHERTSLDAATGNTNMWHGLYHTSNWGKNLMGDTHYDTVYSCHREKYENDNPADTGTNLILWDATTPIAFTNGNNIRYDSAQPIFQHGVVPYDPSLGPTVDNPKCMLSWSDDTGITWSNTILVETGAMGDYTHRSRVTRLGMSRNRVWRISGTDPVPVILVALIIDAMDTGR